jgi:hypothetical protein
VRIADILISNLATTDISPPDDYGDTACGAWQATAQTHCHRVLRIRAVKGGDSVNVGGPTGCGMNFAIALYIFAPIRLTLPQRISAPACRRTLGHVVILL